MNVFDRPVTTYMSRKLETAAPSADLHSLLQTMETRRLSAIPIVNPANVPLGIVSRTDLIHAGLHNIGLRGTSPSLALPNRTAGDLMTPAPVFVAPTLSLREAAHILVDRAIHRVLVVEDQRLIGVLSTLDLAAATYDARIATPISAWMTSPVVTVDAAQPIAAADDLLDRLHVSAVVVVENEWPVGIFGQVEALLCRDLPRDTPVGTVLDPAMICMPGTVRVFRAAAQASQLDVRRVIVTRGPDLAGILGGLDFARIAAAA